MAKCVACRIGLVWECRQGGDCSEEIVLDHANVDGLLLSSGLDSNSSENISSDSSNPRPDDSSNGDPDPESFVTYKDDSSLRDQQSTGRKRAAKMYPLKESTLCEWSMKTNVGGGKFPITGCLANLQQARHHGPDKNTLNNEKGNVHRICHTCHNRWHTLNDPDYVWGDVVNEHDPKAATVEDITASERYWEGRAVIKAKDWQ